MIRGKGREENRTEETEVKGRKGMQGKRSEAEGCERRRRKSQRKRERKMYIEVQAFFHTPMNNRVWFVLVQVPQAKQSLSRIRANHRLRKRPEAFQKRSNRTA